MSKPYPTNYIEARKLWEKTKRKPSGRIKIANNTYLEMGTLGEFASFDIRLHDTVIVEFFEGCIVIHSGGWKTVTTKDRINRAIRPHFNLYQEGHEWWVEWIGTPNECKFEEGMILKHS